LKRYKCPYGQFNTSLLNNNMQVTANHIVIEVHKQLNWIEMQWL